MGETVCTDVEEEVENLRRLLQESESKVAALTKAIGALTQKNESVLAEMDYYKIVFDHAPVLIWFKDSHNNILKINKAAAALAGKSPDQLEGQSTWDIYPADADKYYADDLAVIRSGQPKLGIIERLDTENGRIWVQTDKVPWRDNSGEIKGVVVLVSDITERKRMEDDMMQRNRLESLGRLAGGIAHDFNNLLVGAFGNLELALMAGKPGDPALAYVQNAVAVFDRARDLTLQLLTFAKGGAPIRKVTSLPDLLKATVSFALTGSNVVPIFDFDANLKTADIDRGQICQVIENMVINSKQAMPDGGRLWISAENCRDAAPPEAGDCIKITIRDEGAGIPEEVIGKIFDPFFSTKESGSGLGLATSYSIVARHGGMIKVDSAEGRGATFSIFLPAANSAVQEEIPSNEVCAGAGRVLVMDDESFVRDFLSEALRACGYEPVCVKSGAEAISACREAVGAGRPFKIALLDLTIRGGRGGREICRQLKAIAGNLVTIACSGYSDDPVLADPAAFQFDSALGKPYKLTELSQLLKKF